MAWHRKKFSVELSRQLSKSNEHGQLWSLFAAVFVLRAYACAHLDDLDLVARSEWLGTGKSSVWIHLES